MDLTGLLLEQEQGVAEWKPRYDGISELLFTILSQHTSDLNALIPSDPLVSPVFADLRGLPPLLIQVGDAEVLLDDAARIADNAKSAGVMALYQVWDEAFHVFQIIPDLPEAADALQKVGKFYLDSVKLAQKVS